MENGFRGTVFSVPHTVLPCTWCMRNFVITPLSDPCVTLNICMRVWMTNPVAQNFSFSGTKNGSGTKWRFGCHLARTRACMMLQEFWDAHVNRLPRHWLGVRFKTRHYVSQKKVLKFNQNLSWYCVETNWIGGSSKPLRSMVFFVTTRLLIYAHLCPHEKRESTIKSVW